MFKREITGLILASLATILIFFSNLEIFYLMLLLVCFLLTFELVKVTNEMNIFFWIQIFFIILTSFFRLAGVPKHDLSEPCVHDNSSLDGRIFTKFGTHVLAMTKS